MNQTIPAIDAEIVFSRTLLEGDDLDCLQSFLIERAKGWVKKLRIRRGPGDGVAIDIGRADGLATAIRSTALRRGKTYEALVDAYGKPEFERQSGSAELRGAHSALTIVVSLDEWVVSPVGDKKLLNNRIDIQARGAAVEGHRCSDWVRETFEVLCDRLAPAWGAAYHSDEYRTKVMSRSPSLRAVGRDFSRFFPGLFWLNYFGSDFAQLVDRDRIRSAPAHAVSLSRNGALLALRPEPWNWSSPECRAVEQAVIRELGDKLFFSFDEDRSSSPDERFAALLDRWTSSSWAGRGADTNDRP